ncbi:MAG TPA: MmgE/PrpD family protein [Xanthobacteraceae bacterium]|jgi:2-methylcitrate dehydratase PrpD|nr:MmgE/PrpD family protein [Xanthobacteraceae bacterium]
MSGSSRAEAKPTGVTRVLADFAAQLRGADLPAAITDTLGDLFLDYLRVASIGADMPWSAWSRGYLASLNRQGGAPVLFGGRTLDPVSASFLNTVYAGSIDADDTHVGSMLHPGAIIFSAALAVCGNASGSEFLGGVAAGYEAMIRIGLSIQPTHFRRGFQSTATCGGFGAAVAASRLLFAGQPDGVRRIAESIGLVASFSGGLTQFYQSGSTVKRIHAARAAENGVAAALLAAAGFSGPADIIEGSNGFARAYADGFAPEIITGGLGRDYLMSGVTVKGHACSARVQAAVEGVVALCREHDVTAATIKDFYIGIPSVILGRLTIPRPVDVQAAQMSLPHSAALAAVRAPTAGEGFALSVRDYEDSLNDAAVKNVESRIRCEVDPQVEAATSAESVPARIVLTIGSGATHEIFVPAPKGSPSRPFTRDDHAARFHRELERRWPQSRRDEIIAISRRLSSLPDMQQLVGLLR